MPWCPKCKTEYPEDAESCAICHARLIEQEPNIQEVQDQRVPGNWRTVAEVVGLNWLAHLVGVIVSYFLIRIAAIPLTVLSVHVPRSIAKIIAWIIMLLFVAIIAYWYGRRVRRQLRVGYVFLGWLIWPAWGVVVGLLAHQKHIILGIPWGIATITLYTIATMYGQSRRTPTPNP